MCNEITLKFHGHKYFAMQNSTIDKIQDDIQNITNQVMQDLNPECIDFRKYVAGIMAITNYTIFDEMDDKYIILKLEATIDDSGRVCVSVRQE